jgi:hypothetical protein
MADAYSLLFSGDQVGLIVRGKKSHAHKPDVMEQHADCILSNGAPVGFFGEGNNGSSNSIGMGMQGEVYDFSELSKKRAGYVDQHKAKTLGVVSTGLFIQVSHAEAGKFDKYWSDLAKSPGTFNFLGGNCSTHASDSFIYAGILAGGIPGLDTPNNLYLQICTEKKGKCTMLSGYFGFTAYRGGYLVLVETP